MKNQLLGWLAIALGVYFLITAPEAAANAVQGVGGVIFGVFNSIIIFFTELF